MSQDASVQRRNSRHGGWRQCRRLLALAAVAAGTLLGSKCVGQSSPSQPSTAITIRGKVQNSVGEPLAGASVVLEEKGSKIVETETGKDGTFAVVAPNSGVYQVTAETPGFCRTVDSVAVTPKQEKQLALTLMSTGASCIVSRPGSSAATNLEMKLEDKPSFTIAGITDWSGAGGHGSDTTLRASETLARETLDLKPQSAESGASVHTATDGQREKELRAALVKAPRSFIANSQLGEFYLHAGKPRDALPLLETAHQINPENQKNAYNLAVAYKGNGDLARAREQVRRLLAQQDRADAHHLLGDLNEQDNDPLGAVREYERAARMDASEQNYFSWGAELLLHRAVQPAIQVFSRGTRAHPDSARLLAGLGAALYASGSYDEAARRLCQASDIQPDDSAPYLFLGTMERAVTAPLACSEEKLAQFAEKQPENALGNYYYAVSLWKRAKKTENLAGSQKIELLLEKAVKLDPKFAEAYLQLGMLYSARHDFEKAIVSYRRAIEANPKLAEAHYGLGLAYRKTGQQAKAQHEFQAYAQSERTNSAEVESQRREIRQFLIVMQEHPVSPQR
jgi:tetratricopeptide (TPR) repeat protein